MVHMREREIDRETHRDDDDDDDDDDDENDDVDKCATKLFTRMQSNNTQPGKPLCTGWTPFASSHFTPATFAVR